MTQSLTLRYDRAAPRWRRMIERLGYAAAYDRLIGCAPCVPRGGRIADVGCGSGAMSEAFVRRFGPMHAIHLIDPSEAMLAEASRSLNHCPRTTTERGTLNDIRQKRFDVILCAHVVEHCPSTSDALTQLYAALRPGGALILAASKPHWCTWAVRRLWGHRAFAPSELCRLLHHAQFTDIQTIAFALGPPSRMSHGYIARKGTHPC